MIVVFVNVIKDGVDLIANVALIIVLVNHLMGFVVMDFIRKIN